MHKIAIILVAVHNFRNNYPSAVDNYFIYSLLDKDFALLKKKKKDFKIQHEFSDRSSWQNTDHSRTYRPIKNSVSVSVVRE